MVQLNRHNERGSVTTEFVLVVPLLAVAMLFLLGLGYTLMTKQNAIVGARVAAYYRISRTELPSNSDMSEMVRDAVSPGREEWTLDFVESNIDDPATGRVAIVQGAVNEIYQRFNKENRSTARGTATLGFLPRIMSLGQAAGVYYLPQGTWTCAQTKGGSYTSIALGQMGLPPPINQWVGMSCCETYQASFR